MTDAITLNGITFEENRSTPTGKLRQSTSRGLDVPDTMETLHQNNITDKRNGGLLSRHTVRFTARYAKTGGGYRDVGVALTLTVPESTQTAELGAISTLLQDALDTGAIIEALANNES